MNLDELSLLEEITNFLGQMYPLACHFLKLTKSVLTIQQKRCVIPFFHCPLPQLESPQHVPLLVDEGGAEKLQGIDPLLITINVDKFEADKRISPACRPTRAARSGAPRCAGDLRKQPLPYTILNNFTARYCCLWRLEMSLFSHKIKPHVSCVLQKGGSVRKSDLSEEFGIFWII